MQTISILATEFHIESIDILRGLIMLIMALDHTRDFFPFKYPKPDRFGHDHPYFVFHPLDHPFLRPVIVYYSFL